MISPLVALQRDQVDALRGYGEKTQAHAIGAAVSASERDEAWEAVAAGTADETAEVGEVPYALQSRVRHEQFGEGVVMGYEGDPDRVTVLFEVSGYRTLALDAVRANGLLESVGPPGLEVAKPDGG